MIARVAEWNRWPENTPHIWRIAGGAVAVGVWGQPIIVTACYCDDCRLAAEKLTASGHGMPQTDGGTEFMLFRRDRVACIQGADRLRAMRLTEASKTRRMIADCCATPMYPAFDDKRPWVSAFRAGFGADAPPVEMQICTRFRPAGEKHDDDVPSHPGYPPAMMVRILAAWPGMLFSRAVGSLPS